MDNYKTLVNFKIDFSNINMLIGINGSGKTSIFGVLKKVHEFVLERRPADEIFPDSSLTRWQNVNIQTFEITMKENEKEFIYHLEIEHMDVERQRVRSEYVQLNSKLLFRSENGSARLYNDSFQEGPELLWDWSYSGVGSVYERRDNRLLTEFKQILSKIIICRVKPIEDTAKASEESMFPNYDFSNVTGVYMYISQRYPDSVEKIRKSLKEINPDFMNVYISNFEKEKGLFFDYKCHETSFVLNFGELSDGERLIFQLYILIDCFMEKGFSVFIDEPDSFLSLKEIQPWCMNVEDSGDEKSRQCVIISHHPEIIDFFAQSNGIWLSRLAYGATKIIEAPKTEYGDGKKMKYSEMIIRGDVDELE